MKARIAAMRLLTLSNEPRRIAWRVIAELADHEAGLAYLLGVLVLGEVLVAKVAAVVAYVPRP